MRAGAGLSRLVLVVAVAGCGRALRQEGGVDSSVTDSASDLRDAPAFCLDASDAALQAPDTGDGWCGGEISVSGSTPLGPFCPIQMRTSIGLSMCWGNLAIALADGDGVYSNQMLVLSDLPYDPVHRSWVGNRDVRGYLTGKLAGQPMVFPTTVEITASDDPFAADSSSPGSGYPIGAVHLRFAMQSPAGLLSGTLVAKYCAWVPCLP